MIRVTCQRCGKTTKCSMTANAARWAWPAGGGSMCPKCYDQLIQLRAKYEDLKKAAIRKWMAKGKV